MGKRLGALGAVIAVVAMAVGIALPAAGSTGNAAQCDLSGDRNSPEPALGPGLFLWRAGWPAGGLVVEGQFPQEFAGGGVEDADAEVLDEQQDVGSGVDAADAAKRGAS